MIIQGKWYDILKWLDLVCIPAFVTAYCGLAAIWQFPYPEEIASTSAVVCTLIGALLGISSSNYYKQIAEQEKVIAYKAE